jgi:hypothetical protein
MPWTDRVLFWYRLEMPHFTVASQVYYALRIILADSLCREHTASTPAPDWCCPQWLLAPNSSRRSRLRPYFGPACTGWSWPDKQRIGALNPKWPQIIPLGWSERVRSRKSALLQRISGDRWAKSFLNASNGYHGIFSCSS